VVGEDTVGRLVGPALGCVVGCKVVGARVGDPDVIGE